MSVLYCHFSGKSYLDIAISKDVIGYLALMDKGGHLTGVITQFVTYSAYIDQRAELIADAELFLQCTEYESPAYDAVGFLPLYIDVEHWAYAFDLFKELFGPLYIFKSLLFERKCPYLLDTCKRLFYMLPENIIKNYTTAYNKYTIEPEYRLPCYIRDNLDFLGIMYIAQVVGKVAPMISIHAHQFLTYMAEEEIRRGFDYKITNRMAMAHVINLFYIQKTYGKDFTFLTIPQIEDIIDHFYVKVPLEFIEQKTAPINNIATAYVEQTKYYKKITDLGKIMLGASFLNCLLDGSDYSARLKRIKDKNYTEVMFSVHVAIMFITDLIIQLSRGHLKHLVCR